MNNAMQSVSLYMCLTPLLHLSQKSFTILYLGELDPERMGSGIQYGDTSIRRMPKESLGPSSKRPDCAC